MVEQAELEFLETHSSVSILIQFVEQVFQLLLLESLEPDARADQRQLLLAEVAIATNTQLCPDGPDPALGGVGRGAPEGL